jgi:hypothetical protein
MRLKDIPQSSLRLTNKYTALGGILLAPLHTVPFRRRGDVAVSDDDRTVDLISLMVIERQDRHSENYMPIVPENNKQHLCCFAPARPSVYLLRLERTCY